MFFMRGAWSNQLYQPKVNHRPMDYRKFMEPHKSSDDSRVHPPLMASMMDSDLTYKFDTSTPMTLHFYELERTQSDIPFTQTIRTTSPLRTDLCDSNTTEYLEGCLADAKAVPITANAFTRLCCLFNVKWTGDEVTLRDLKGFVALLSGCSITSVEDLKAFVKRFQMEHLFCVDENTGVTSQLNRLGKLFRALVSVRIAAPEGQHRIGLTSLMCTGFCKPTGRAPLAPQAFGHSQMEALRFKRFREMQIFGSMKLQIVNAVPDRPDEAYALMRLFGDHTTAGGNVSINQSTEEYTLALLDSIMTKQNEPGVLARLGWDNYWKANGEDNRVEYDKWLREISIVIDCKFQKNQSAQMHFCRMMKGGAEWDKCMTSLTKIFKVRTSTVIREPAAGHGLELQRMGFLAKMACLCPEYNHDLTQFLRGPISSEPQAPLEDTVPATSFAWLNECIVEPMTVVNQLFFHKILTELKLIKTIRQHGHKLCLREFVKAKIDSDFDWADPHTPNYKYDAILQLDLPKHLKPGVKASSTEIGCGRQAKVCDLMQFATFTTFFMDIISVINKIGINPLLQYPGDDKWSWNKYARAYL